MTDSKIDDDHQVLQDLLAILRHESGEPSLRLAETPRRLTGGFWARLFAFRLDGAPAAWQGDLVLRVMPDPGTAAKETVIQAAVAAQGYPTPTVHLSGGPDDGLGEAFLVMDLAPGSPLLDGLSGAGAVAALPKLARRLPDALAEAMAGLHRLDAAPVRAGLLEAGAGGLGIEAVLAGYAAVAERCDRADLVAAAQWLTQNPLAPMPAVVCHGDLHPFNLLVATDGAVTVLDWSAALLAPPTYDVAFTGLLLSEPPVMVPRLFRPIVAGAGRWLARRFRRAYERESGRATDPLALRWFEAVVCLRALVEVAGWVAADQLAEHRGHPWLVSGPAFAERLADLTGARISAR